jgi:hypothetical protein
MIILLLYKPEQLNKNLEFSSDRLNYRGWRKKRMFLKWVVVGMVMSISTTVDFVLQRTRESYTRETSPYC